MYHSSTESTIETDIPVSSVGSTSPIVMDQESNIGGIPTVSNDETPPPSIYIEESAEGIEQAAGVVTTPPPSVVVDLQQFISDFPYPDFSDISPPEQSSSSTTDMIPEPYNPEDWFPVSPASVPMTLEDLDDYLDDLLNIIGNDE